MFPDIKVYVDGEEMVVKSVDIRSEMAPMHFFSYDDDFTSMPRPVTHYFTIEAIYVPSLTPPVTRDEIVGEFLEIIQETK